MRIGSLLLLNPPSDFRESTDLDVSRKQQLSLRWLALCLLIVVLAWPNLVRLTGDLSYLSARWLAQSGNDRGALWLLTQARRLQPDQPNAFALASAIHYRAGELEASVAQLQAGIENGAAYPHPQLLNDLAVRRYEEGDLDGALNLQEQAAANAPNVAVAQFNLGTLYWRGMPRLRLDPSGKRPGSTQAGPAPISARVGFFWSLAIIWRRKSMHARRSP